MGDDEQRKWPVGGYAPGLYICECRKCSQRFQGDKRAYECPDCVIQRLIALPAAAPAEDVRAGALKEAAAVIAKNGAEATAAAMILHIAETLRAKGKAVLTTGDDFGAQVLQFADALALIPDARP